MISKDGRKTNIIFEDACFSNKSNFIIPLTRLSRILTSFPQTLKKNKLDKRWKRD